MIGKPQAKRSSIQCSICLVAPTFQQDPKSWRNYRQLSTPNFISLPMMGSSPIYLDMTSYYPRPALTFSQTACHQAIPARTQHTACSQLVPKAPEGPACCRSWLDSGCSGPRGALLTPPMVQRTRGVPLESFLLPLCPVPTTECSEGWTKLWN